MKLALVSLFALSLTFPGCHNSELESEVEMGNHGESRAIVVDVSTSGNPGSYTFFVTVESPDTGCDQYADWWEILSESGELLYRRVLLHSHVSEQPFTRSGGPVNIDAGEVVIVRAHMNNLGYGSNAMKGSVDSGFSEVVLDTEFAAGVAMQEPLPTDCAF